jgi:hypothetical protein
MKGIPHICADQGSACVLETLKYFLLLLFSDIDITAILVFRNKSILSFGTLKFQTHRLKDLELFIISNLETSASHCFVLYTPDGRSDVLGIEVIDILTQIIYQ